MYRKPTASSTARSIRRRPDELEFLPATLEIIHTPASPVGRSIASAIIGSFALALLWACLGHIDIISTAQGKIVPSGKSKTIQPLEAGMITSVRVKDGDYVQANDILVELDHTITAAERKRIYAELKKTSLDVARLAALASGLPDEGVGQYERPNHVSGLEDRQNRALAIAQSEQQRSKIRSFDKQIAQKEAEVREVDATHERLSAGLPFIDETASIREKLLKQEFGNRLAYLDSQLRLSDQRHELEVQRQKRDEIASAKSALEAQRDQAHAEYARSVMTELLEARQKLAQCTEDLTKAHRRIEEQIIRSPVNGTVQQLAIHTLGGVVSPAQQLMIIVPSDSPIEAEAMITNKDIGFVREGQDAEVKVDTFNFTKYGLVHGTVLNVSRDAIVRDKSDRINSPNVLNGLSQSSEPPGQELVYSARVKLDRLSMLIDDRIVRLSPGMAVTVEIKTGRRRIIEFLLSPILRYGHEAARER